jgi:phosphoglycolate phosphatase
VTALLAGRCGDPRRALIEFRERYGAAATPPESLYPGVRQGLRRLRDHGVGLAVFSNKPQGLCDKVLADLGLSAMFDAIVGTAPGIPLKPDPAGLDVALGLAGGTRATSCFVGDSEADYAMARAAGVPAIMVSWGYGEAGRDWPGAQLAHSFEAATALVPRALSAEAIGA